MLRFLAVCALLAACAPKYQDSRSADLLNALNESTNAHFEYLIKTYGTPDCAYSTETSLSFWEGAEGELRVIGARTEVMNPEAKPAFDALDRSYSDFRQTLGLLESKSVSNRWEDKCMDPTSLMKYLVAVSEANSVLEQVLR